VPRADAGNAPTVPSSFSAVTEVCVFARLRAAGLGDLVQRNIMLWLLRQACPLARITVVTGADLGRRFAEFLWRHSYADDVWTDEGGDRLWSKLVDRGVQLCLVDPDSDLDARHARQAGVPVRIGLATGEPGDEAITHPMLLPPSLFAKPDLFEYAVALATALGLPGPLAPSAVVPPLPMTAEEVPEVAGPGPHVAVHPGGDPRWHRRWPLDHYADLCARATDQAGATICLVGVRSEIPELEALAVEVTRRAPGSTVHVSAGNTLNRTANLIAGADLLVGNDSSPVHIAAAVHTPSVVIHGPTVTEFLWARIYPWHYGVSLRYPCQRLRSGPLDPYKRQCPLGCPIRYRSPEDPYPRCLADLDVDRVWRLVSTTLSGSNGVGDATSA
jgi:ADP-heptose:LPS heptosyltransferase